MSSLCRICMESSVEPSMALFNKKNEKKTDICLTYEKITNLNVQNDELPKNICFPCVCELNKYMAFRDKCIRTYKTLSAFYKMSDGTSDEEKEMDIPIDIIQEKADEEHTIQELVVSQDNSAEQNTSSHMIEISSLMSPEERSDEKTNDETDVVLVYCINDPSEIEEQTPAVKSDAYKCSVCAMEFVRKKNFENHYLKYHEKEDHESSPPKQIRLQLTKEKNEEDLKETLSKDPNAKNCKYCNALFLNEKSLKIHERRLNCQQDSFECAQCKKVFVDENLFQQHVNSHDKEPSKKVTVDDSKKYKCTYENCHKSFSMMSTLRDHQRTHDQSKPYVCSICNRGFSQNTNLKQHLRRHNEIKPFKCDWDISICTKSFVSKGELESHLRKHSGAHPFACESCDSKFTTSSSLVKHRRIHSGEKPYSCDFCPMRFTALGTLKNHQKTHTGERPHTCRYCDKSFAQKSDMTSHERTHTQSRPYSCKICNMSFHQNGTLKTHLKIHSKTRSHEAIEEEDK